MTHRKTPAVVHSSEDCRSALQRMGANGTDRLAVVEDERLVGLITQEDIHRLVAEAVTDPEEDSFLRFVNVGGAMQYGPATIPATASFHEAARAMVEQGVDQLLIVENGKPRGLLTALEALRVLLDEARSEVTDLTKVSVPSRGKENVR